MVAASPAAGRRPSTALSWARSHLFSTPLDSVLTVLTGGGFALLTAGAIRFMVNSEFRILRVNLALFMVGAFPRSQLWRVAVAGWILAAMVGAVAGLIRAGTTERALQAGMSSPARLGLRGGWHALRRFWPLALLVVVCLGLTETIRPLLVTAAAIGVLIGGYLTAVALPTGPRVWLRGVVALMPLAAYFVLSSSGLGWDTWGGFMLNLFLTVAGILFAFPIGMLLALGRRSTLPIVRAISVGYIELVRGVPLITLLLMGVFALGFFLPSDLRPSDVTRVLVAITMFEAAYIAEVIRGGLQAVPRGQTEAAQSLGLPGWKTTRLIVLPQALRATIPAMVGQFISLFKDTTLVAAVGLGDVLAASSFANAQPDFNARGLASVTLPFV
ncbi:MAG: amino acid ABC transporter permease, partial [Actinomycetota bacterium]